MNMGLIITIGAAIIAALIYILGKKSNQLEIEKEKKYDAEQTVKNYQELAKIDSRPHSSGTDIRNRMRDGNM